MQKSIEIIYVRIINILQVFERKKHHTDQM